jgi:hypothetical protein
MSITAMKMALEALEHEANKGNDNAYQRERDALNAAIEAAKKQEPVAWDVFELRLYGAPQEKQHRVLWVDRYMHPDGSTPDLDGLLEAATKDGGIDGGAKTLYVRPLYTTPPAAERNKVAQWMIAKGYATGHGDTVEDLLQELEWQIAENWTRGMVNGVQAEREECAKLCEDKNTLLAWPTYAAAIRARGQS